MGHPHSRPWLADLTEAIGDETYYRGSHSGTESPTRKLQAASAKGRTPKDPPAGTGSKNGKRRDPFADNERHGSLGSRFRKKALDGQPLAPTPLASGKIAPDP